MGPPVPAAAGEVSMQIDSSVYTVCGDGPIGDTTVYTARVSYESERFPASTVTISPSAAVARGNTWYLYSQFASHSCAATRYSVLFVSWKSDTKKSAFVHLYLMRTV